MARGITPNKKRRVIEAHTEADGKVPCTFCGFRMRTDSCTIDHDRALSRGGGSGEDNLKPACGRCNAKKGPVDGNEFRAWLSEPRGRNWLIHRPTEAEYRRRHRSGCMQKKKKKPWTWLPPEEW